MFPIAAVLVCALDGCGKSRAVPLPNLSISDASTEEGDLGVNFITFSIQLSSPRNIDVTVTYSTSDGTAIAGSDYYPATGNVTIPAGYTSLSLGLSVKCDRSLEPDETFLVTLSNPVNAAISDAQAVGTILNDDTMPSITIDDSSVTEGDSGTTDLTFTVTLSEASGLDVSFDFQTADDSAKALDQDFLPRSGSIKILPGETSAQIVVPVLGDTHPEQHEVFAVVLSNPIGAVIERDTGYGWIMNDDAIILRVDLTGDNTDGHTWATALTDINYALWEAYFLTTSLGTHGEVWVAAGTYPDVTMFDDVDMYGGFEGYASGLGKQESVRSDRDWQANNTILDAQKRSIHVVTGASNAVIDGFTITRGFSDLPYPSLSGAGVSVAYCTNLKIANCAITNNEIRNGGGAYVSNSDVVFLNCTFDSNIATTFAPESGGGGLYCDNGNVDVVNSVFVNNRSSSNGAGVLVRGGTVSLSNCLLYGNDAEWEGGGLCLKGTANVTVSDCTLCGNVAPKGWGGVFLLDQAVCSIKNSILVHDGPPEEIGVPPGATCTVSYSCVQGTTPGVNGNIDADPLFEDPANGKFRLSVSSPCIDAADNFAIPPDSADIDQDGDVLEPLPLDLDFNPRTVDDPATIDTGNGSPPIVDMGAYEYQ